jgi:hypothetical protein
MVLWAKREVHLNDSYKHMALSFFNKMMLDVLRDRILEMEFYTGSEEQNQEIKDRLIDSMKKLDFMSDRLERKNDSLVFSKLPKDLIRTIEKLYGNFFLDGILEDGIVEYSGFSKLSDFIVNRVKLDGGEVTIKDLFSIDIRSKLTHLLNA